MTATEAQYILDINEEFLNYTNKVSKRDRLGISKDRTMFHLRLMLLEAFIEIMENYLRDTVTSDDNFFTVSEAEDIMQHINLICDSDHWVDLS